MNNTPVYTHIEISWPRCAKKIFYSDGEVWITTRELSTGAASVISTG